MSISHLIDPANTNLEDLYIGALTASGTTIINGATTFNNAVIFNGDGKNNYALTIQNTGGFANSILFFQDTVLSGAISSSNTGLVLNGALSDPSYDLTLATAAANKTAVTGGPLQVNQANAIRYDALATVTGGSPLTSNQSATLLSFTGVGTVIANGTAPVTLTWTSSKVTASSVIRAQIMSHNCDAGSIPLVESVAGGVGSASLVINNGGSVATGAGKTITILVEIVF